MSYNINKENNHIVHDTHLQNLKNNIHYNLQNDDNDHTGHTNIKAMVLTEDVLHKNDGNLYTSNNILSDAFVKGSAKSVDQQINEMKVGALKSKRESLAAKQVAADYLHRMKELQAEEELTKVEMLQKQKDDINQLLHSPKHELTKDVMPIVAVTPHSFGFLEHDKLELERLNNIREAALKEAEMQKRNALLHGKVSSHNIMDSLTKDPKLYSDFYSKTPVKKTSVVVDPTKGHFSVFSGEKMENDFDSTHFNDDNISKKYMDKYNNPNYNIGVPEFLNHYVDENINKTNSTKNNSNHNNENLSSWI
ncbi:hypothetical protein NAPIS_ORF01972 [Vairimorpha apis BRL 01]|uniref:Uncharacterized protein n=1 Tax=Vairimorpha apis BRL 01 TaxID=1037528 RepID=T0L7N0_9MICR|nr:hypothetical protein NAPIS_ORF01972 [Vairimorpha apis BRL 01]